jgi:hypothetical protein
MATAGTRSAPSPPRRCRRRKCGRDFSALTISYKAPLYDTGIPDRDGTRRSFSGKPGDIAGDIHSFAAAGVHELIFDFRGESIADSIERLQRFAAEVMPLVGDGR